MKLLTRISSWLRNKYLIAICLFAAIILFFDKNDLFTQVTRTRQLKQLQQSKAYYTQQIDAEQKELEKLRSNPVTLEKYAREKYMMKRENEDLFLVSEKPVKPNN
jgi:cell division protein DivIC